MAAAIKATNSESIRLGLVLFLTKFWHLSVLINEAVNGDDDTAIILSGFFHANIADLGWRTE